jgi:hypothetical protein
MGVPAVITHLLAWQGVARLDGGFVGGWIKAGYPFAR